MKLLKKLILPVLTCLTVLAAVLLPPRISQAGDARLMGQIHAENVKVEDYSEPATLAQRIDLLARWTAGDKTLTGITQMLYSDLSMTVSLQDRAQMALWDLTEALPLLGKDLWTASGMDQVKASSLLLRDPASGLSANLYQIQWEAWSSGDDNNQGKKQSISLILDEETNLILSLTTEGHLMDASPTYDKASKFNEEQAAQSFEKLGYAYLDYLRVEGDIVYHQIGYGIVFRIPEANDAMYQLQSDNDTFFLGPAAIERDRGDRIDLTNDGNLMQKSR